MSQPTVNQTETDGALGVLPPSSGDLLSVVGISSAGPLNTPSTYGDVAALVADYGIGPGIEACARHISVTGNPVCFTRCDQTTAGTSTAIVFTGTGTSVVTQDVGTEPRDDYEVYFKVINGGTIGVSGITFQYSLDGGRTLSPITALGTANNFAPEGGVRLNFAAGTLVAGDLATYRTTAPKPSTGQIATALAALKNTQIAWEICELAFPIATTEFDEIELDFASIFGAKKFRTWIGNVRIPTIGESEAAYLTSLAGFATKATKVGNLCAGSCEMVSAVTRRIYQRPISFAVASLEASVKRHVNIADIDLGPITAVSIRDANGNPKYHDESVNPGLDDARFTVLRTWEGEQGAYVNRSRIFSATGSDFYLCTHRRVMNLARATTLAYFRKRLAKPIRVSETTGFILEADALEIERGAKQRLSAVLGVDPMASGWNVVIKRNVNILATRTLKATTRVVPLAYAEVVEEDIGFENPVLRLVAA
jgi:hypothetical protein